MSLTNLHYNYASIFAIQIDLVISEQAGSLSCWRTVSLNKYFMINVQIEVKCKCSNITFLHSVGKKSLRREKNVGWLFFLRIYVTLAVFQPYRDLEAGENQSLKFKWRGGESNPIAHIYESPFTVHYQIVISPWHYTIIDFWWGVLVTIKTASGIDAAGGCHPIPGKSFMFMSKPKSKVYYCVIKS